MNKIIKTLLLVLSFVIIFSIISNTFDGDFGWHLRFGRDAWAQNFQYQDSYTWGYLGLNWINHEWGGDLLFWFLYSQLGYYSLVVLISLALGATYLIAQRIFSTKISIASLAITIFCIFASKHIFVMRLAMLSPLFFVALWYTLERIPQKKYFYFWPILFWLWSALHGSWILGFITIGIYGAGNLGQIFINRYWPGYYQSVWDKKTFYQVIAAALISLPIILLNPYGIGMWQEVIHYFSSSFYKSHITEWVPSYTYPIFWLSLIIQTLGLFFAVLIWRAKKINLAQLLLVTAFFCSGFLYKRNALFAVIVSVPILTAIAEEIKNKLAGVPGIWKNLVNDKKLTTFIKLITITAIVLLLSFFVSKIHYTSDVWADKELLVFSTMPYSAGEFLQKNYPGQNRIFNEFRWGGYLNWILPNSLVYFDGRGTATWKIGNKYMLEKYYNLKFDPGGLKELETNHVNLAFIQRSNYFPFGPPDWSDRKVFGKRLNEIMLNPETAQLEKDLTASPNWKLVYTDEMSKIWEKAASSTP